MRENFMRGSARGVPGDWHSYRVCVCMMKYIGWNMEPCNTWNCINSFALWISAIGTVSVSALALWLSIRDKYIRMSNRFSLGLIGGEDPMVLNRKVFVLEFTNIGVRPVTVTNYKWKIPLTNNKGFSVTFPQMDHRVTALCTKLPIELTDGKSGQLFHTNDFFSGINKPEEFMYPRRKLLAFIKIWFFRIYISTSIGMDIPVKVDRAVRKSLWKEYREIHT